MTILPLYIAPSRYDDADAARRSLGRQGDEARVSSLIASGERREALRLAEALLVLLPHLHERADVARATIGRAAAKCDALVHERR